MEAGSSFNSGQDEMNGLFHVSRFGLKLQRGKIKNQGVK
jgi:hypothetical protein